MGKTVLESHRKLRTLATACERARCERALRTLPTATWCRRQRRRRGSDLTLRVRVAVALDTKLNGGYVGYVSCVCGASVRKTTTTTTTTTYMRIGVSVDDDQDDDDNDDVCMHELSVARRMGARTHKHERKSYVYDSCTIRTLDAEHTDRWCEL